MLEATRTPLGKIISRTVKSAVYTTNLPGAPDGQYVVIQYESSFEHKKAAIGKGTDVRKPEPIPHPFPR
jgi:hypothetical protein